MNTREVADVPVRLRSGTGGEATPCEHITAGTPDPFIVRFILPRRVKTFVLRPGLMLLLLLGSNMERAVPASERLEPADGCYLGFHCGSTDTITRLASRLGITPAVFGRFLNFPLSASDRGKLTNFLNEVVANGAMAMITLEPQQGLAAISPTACADFGMLCAAYEQAGVDGIFIRFAHEMNGNWYAWGQQPVLYKQKFRLLAQSVHSRTTRTAMLWAPNYGVGYPFGTPRSSPGSADFILLDTDKDGVLTPADDMYEPYYPGDDTVDWVGLTLYHWGVNYPWFENELPLPNSFARSLNGTYQGKTPDFYARYCVDGVHNKPMSIPETAAFYNTSQPGPGEFELKRGWWRQVFNVEGDTTEALDVARHFSKLKCIAWFDQYKQEAEAKNSWIDWRVSSEQRIRNAFVEDVRRPHNGQPYFMTAQEARWRSSPYAITASNLPQRLPLSGKISVSLNAKTQTNCDLVIDLLDADYQWQGGTRVAITARTESVTAGFPLVKILRDGGQYRWNVFLTPIGRSYQQALAWYICPQSVARMLEPAIAISSSPPVVVTGSNFSVRVKYVAPESCFVLIRLVDEASRLIGSGSASVATGDGRIDVPMVLTGDAATGTQALQGYVSASLQLAQIPVAASLPLPLLIRPSLDVDLITVAAEPSIVPVREVLHFDVSYAATTDRDLHIDLFDAESNYLASAVQPVSSGSGICDMTISFPGAIPGEYFISGFMTPPAQPWPQAVAWSTSRRLTIIGTDYQRWAESFWGVILQNDPVSPNADPDSDGADNAYEFLTHTDPRNGESVLKLKLARTTDGLTISWPSVAGHAYQLLRSAGMTRDSWTPVAKPIAGSGTLLKVSVPPNQLPTFYRVQLMN